MPLSDTATTEARPRVMVHDARARTVQHVAVQIDVLPVDSPSLTMDAQGDFALSTPGSDTLPALRDVENGFVDPTGDVQDGLVDALPGDQDIADVLLASSTRSRPSFDTPYPEPRQSATRASNDEAARRALVVERRRSMLDCGAVRAFADGWSGVWSFATFLNRVLQIIGVQLAQFFIEFGLGRPAMHASRLAMFALFFYSLVVLVIEGKSGGFKSFAALIGAAVFGKSAQELSIYRAP